MLQITKTRRKSQTDPGKRVNAGAGWASTPAENPNGQIPFSVSLPVHNNSEKNVNSNISISNPQAPSIDHVTVSGDHEKRLPNSTDLRETSENYVQKVTGEVHSAYPPLSLSHEPIFPGHSDLSCETHTEDINYEIMNKSDENITDDPNSDTEEGVIEVISSTCWYVSGELGGMKTELLVDSGSSYTVIDYNLFRQIPERQRPTLHKVNLVLRSATGEKLKIFGQINVDIKLGDKKFATPVKVVALGDKTAILGLDFMAKYDCMINMGKGVLQMEPDMKIKLHRQAVHKCARIQAYENVCIPPNHEMIIKGRINQKHQRFDDVLGTVEPTSSLAESKGLLVARALVNTEPGLVPIKVANFTPNQIQLDQGYTIAMLHQVDSRKISAVPANNEKVVANTENSPVKQELPEHLKPMLEGIYEGATEIEKQQVKQLLIDYQDCFTAPGGKLGRTNVVQFEIDTGDHRPVRQKLRIPPLHLQKAVDDEIKKNA